ncbi:MAG: glutamate racemase [Actinomycetota bacterium]|nr:glutamate racemase [Actinomycetota bacterium]
MDNRAIGVFDSGVGGLTVLREIIKSAPGENTIYFGDTKRVPYGPRDLGEVKRFVFKITGFLYERNVKLIVIACNTSTAAALKDLKKNYDIPVIGVIEPGARTAVSNTVNKRVGVIATRGTVESDEYRKEIARIDKEIETFQVPAPLLVEYIENGILTGENLDRAIDGYLKPLLDKGIDVLILGCTHFPLIEKRILSRSGDGIRVISSAVETAKDVKKILVDKNLGADGSRKPQRFFYETGSTSKFLEVGKMFLGEEIKEVKKTKLDM